LADLEQAYHQALHKCQTNLQRAFVQHYLVERSMTEAALAAGYSERNATQSAYQALGSKKVQAAIRAGQAYLNAFHMVDLHRITRLLWVESDFDPGDFFESAGGSTMAVRSLEQLTPDQRKCISSMKQTQHGIEIKFVDRLRAKALLAKLGGYEAPQKHEVGGPGMTPLVEDREIRVTFVDSGEAGDRTVARQRRRPPAAQQVASTTEPAPPGPGAFEEEDDD
jgi:phage terminase small subunit